MTRETFQASFGQLSRERQGRCSLGVARVVRDISLEISQRFENVSVKRKDLVRSFANYIYTIVKV